MRSSEKRKKDIDFNAETEVFKILSREVNQEEGTSDKLSNDQRKKLDEPRDLRKQLPGNECRCHLPTCGEKDKDGVSDKTYFSQATIGQVVRLQNGKLANTFGHQWKWS